MSLSQGENVWMGLSCDCTRRLRQHSRPSNTCPAGRNRTRKQHLTLDHLILDAPSYTVMEYVHLYHQTAGDVSTGLYRTLLGDCLT